MMRQAISKNTARAEGVGEVGAAGDLSVVGHQDNVVGGEGFHDRSASSGLPGGRNGTTGTSRPDVELVLRGVTLKSRGLSFMQATTVAQGDWKCRTQPTSGLFRIVPRWNPASIVGRTPVQ